MRQVSWWDEDCDGVPSEEGEGPNKDRIFYKCPDRNVSYFIVFNDYG